MIAATSEHLERLVELETACAWHPWSPRALAAALEERSTRVWLDGDAYCITRVVVDEAELHSIGVHPRSRRRGHAHRLLSTVQAGWRREGLSAAFLEVREANAAARGLYLRLGWVEDGRRRDYYGTGEHAVCMRWTP